MVIDQIKDLSQNGGVLTRSRRWPLALSFPGDFLNRAGLAVDWRPWIWFAHLGVPLNLFGLCKLISWSDLAFLPVTPQFCWRPLLDLGCPSKVCDSMSSTNTCLREQSNQLKTYLQYSMYTFSLFESHSDLESTLWKVQDLSDINYTLASSAPSPPSFPHSIPSQCVSKLFSSSLLSPRSLPIHSSSVSISLYFTPDFAPGSANHLHLHHYLHFDLNPDAAPTKPTPTAPPGYALAEGKKCFDAGKFKFEFEAKIGSRRSK